MVLVSLLHYKLTQEKTKLLWSAVCAYTYICKQGMGMYCIIAQTTCIQLTSLLLYQVMQLLLTPSHQIKTPQLHKFVVKVNSVNLGYERVAVLGKDKSMVCLFLKHKFPLGQNAHLYYFHHVPVQWILFEHKNFIPLSESRPSCL